MGVLEKLNEYPKATAAGVLGVTIVALYLGMSSFQGDATAASGHVQAFFTVDDGKSYFADDASKPPGSFSRDGKPAYRAYVFRAGSGEPFVGYLERYSPAAPAKAAPAAVADDAASRNPSAMRGKGRSDPAQRGGPSSLAEVKRPGSGEWVRLTDPAAVELLKVRSGDGKRDDLEPVLPSR